jgi:hypothetical protein
VKTRFEDVEKFVKSRMANWRELSLRHFPESDDFITVVVKGHLLLEQYLTALIGHYCVFPERLVEARLSFLQKLRLTKALLFLPVSDHIWEALELLNKIRNDVAHNLDKSSKLAAHLSRMRGLTPIFGNVDEATLKDLKDDTQAVKFLVSHCEGYLTPVDVLVATAEKKMKRYTDKGHSESGADFG